MIEQIWYTQKNLRLQRNLSAPKIMFWTYLRSGFHSQEFKDFRKEKKVTLVLYNYRVYRIQILFFKTKIIHLMMGDFSHTIVRAF